MQGKKVYETDVTILKKYGNQLLKITNLKGVRNPGFEIDRNFSLRGSVNDEKLDCNISRARQKVYEYAYCNDFDWFVTLTINEKKYDRSDLKGYYRDFSQFLRNYKRIHQVDIQYLFIPELHSDGKSWHMHGFIKGLPESHIVKNDNGYWDWIPYRDRFGWISLDHIKDRGRCAGYITKYISKNLSDCVKELNARMYYSSRGLKTAEEIKRGHLSKGVPWSYEGDYCRVATFAYSESVHKKISEWID